MEPDKARALTRQWQHKQPAERAAIIREHFGAMLHALTHLIPDDAPTAVVEADEHPVIAAVVERQLLLLEDDETATEDPTVRCDSVPLAEAAAPRVSVAARLNAEFGPPVLRAEWTWTFSTRQTIRFDTLFMSTYDDENSGRFVRALANAIGWPLDGNIVLDPGS